jgi:Tol biopolymer transport system component
MLVLLASMLLAAPIPKGAGTYEGQIACLISGPTPSVLILKPDGSEVLTWPLTGIDGHGSALRQARRGEFVLLETQQPNGLPKIYRLDLEKNAKPKLIHELTAGQTTWSITGDGKSAVYSEGNDQNQYTHYKHDLATGKRVEIKLNGNFMIEDFAQATDDLVLCYKMSDDWQMTVGTAIVSISTGKAVFQKDGYSGSRCISPDAKWILNSAYRRENGQLVSQLESFTVATGKATPIPFPDGSPVNQSCFSVSADGKGACYGSSTQNGSKLYMANLERKTAKLIYTSPNGSRIVDCDWR